MTEALALNHYKLADVLSASGDGKGAELNYREGLRLAESLPVRAPALLHRGHIFLGDMKIQNGDPRGSLAEYQLAVEIIHSWPEGQARLPFALARTGDALQETGDLEGALERYQQVLALGATKGRSLMVTHHSLGNVLGNPYYLHLGRRKEAEQHYRSALAIAERNTAADSHNALAKTDVAASCWRLGTVVDSPTEAVALERRAIAAVSELLQAAPNNSSFLRMQVFQQMALGDALRSGRMYDDSAKAFNEAVRIGRSLSETDPARAQFLHDVPVALLGLGQTLFQSGAMAPAKERFSEALELARHSAAEHRDDLSCHRYVAEANESSSIDAVSLAGGAPRTVQAVETWESRLEFDECLVYYATEARIERATP